MTLIRRVLLLPCLLPVVAVLVLSAMNRSGTTQLQVLIWRSPPLPLGAWTAIAAATGASLSGVAALLLIPGRAPLRRTLHQPMGRPAAPDPEIFEPTASAPVAPPPPVMPERDVRDPAPTVAVPYRVIQRPQTSPAEARSQESRSGGSSTGQEARNSHRETDDWDQDPDRDW